MKKYIGIAFLAAALVLSNSCQKYLDIVPSGTATLDDAFKRPDEALNFLYSLYSFQPPETDLAYAIGQWATDEMAIPWIRGTSYGYLLISGQLNTSNPLFDYWSGNGPISMYDGIRQCHTFIEYIDRTPGFSESEKIRMKGEAKFLVGYLHFVLLRQYGPIVIMKEAVPLDAPEELYYPKRTPYDECIEYIVQTLDEAASVLPEGAPDGSSIAPNEYGRVSATAAKAIKSRVLLYAASPAYNGNAEYYSNFTDKDGVQLMSLVPDDNKWKLAADAALEAISRAEGNGYRLYETSQAIADPFKKAETNYRYTMVEPWNRELLWGYSVGEGYYGWQRHSAPRNAGTDMPYNGHSPTLKMVEEYYTADGLPIEIDPEYDYNGRYNLDGETIKLHHNREPRFYASIGYDRGPYEFNNTTTTLNMRFDETHGYNTTTAANNYSPTGYLLKKGVHPQSIITNSQNSVVQYPWPIIRLAELYLNYAEALNEYGGEASHANVIQYLDRVRTRAGIPGVLEAWAKVGKSSFTKEEMREIIRKERRIELAYEGNRIWDIRRWKLGNEYFNVPVRGWNIRGAGAADFYQQTNVPDNRFFATPAYYLFPIRISELEINKNLVQNPGWD